MKNPVLEKRLEQFRALASEDARRCVLFATLPSIHWMAVYAALLFPDASSLAGFIGGIAGIVSGFLSAIAATWATGRDYPARQRALLWALSFYALTPALSWVVGLPALWGGFD